MATEYIYIVIGALASILGFFLKKENQRLSNMEKLIHSINLTLAKNEAIDTERWSATNKRLEDRRLDIRKIYDLIQKNDT